MKQVKQINEFCCVPACLEAIFSDIGIEKSQDEIVRDNPEVFNKNGVANFTSTWGSVFERYGIHVSLWFEEKTPYDCEKLKKIASDPNNKILLLWRKGDKHAVCLKGIRDNGDIEVMDPASDKSEVYNIAKQKELNLFIVSFTVKETTSSKNNENKTL